ncbi:transcription elongation factor, GreA/GreB famil y [Formosa agariphila KMM 3901]|uniref:Transcription elongation factor, GreA/GreB famil y n=1 Tax=Formosa agariphila (strain DSM 15362 / KCTC 12365 / LMG 23005 / KMM 3901 / M-2Alg 35-1) TaxID=1347342 RepID=T2KKE4_FORAG|nr:GreA/GreB family elongation factor [Formosa agariphila]CDF79230.1 transcription elongation factor, GreA/GreB famil y [Formosa agariphila KMM 3901]
MKYGHLILEKKEYVFLKRILNLSGYSKDIETKKSLQKLSNELVDAEIVDNENMPDDVIRFNSMVTVSHGDWEKTIKVVIPQNKDLSLNKISILTPMGSALFGYAIGDIISWEFPGGTKQLKIIAVEQEFNYNGLDIVI